VEKLAEYGSEKIRPELLINGNDLIGLGFKPGPLFSEILGLVEDRQLEGGLTTREEALEWVRSHWRP
jgi:poly(A) polymerase